MMMMTTVQREDWDGGGKWVLPAGSASAKPFRSMCQLQSPNPLASSGPYALVILMQSILSMCFERNSIRNSIRDRIRALPVGNKQSLQ